MSKIEKEIKTYALEALREYLVYSDIEPTSKEELLECYKDMEKKGYFYKAIINDAFDEVKEILKKVADAYEKDHEIIDKDLIFMGPEKVLNKLGEKKSTRKI